MMTTAKRAWTGRLTDEAIALVTALSEHFSKLGAPTTQTAVVEMAIKALARTEKVSAKTRHYREEL